jgi:hypothetical protein
VEDRSGGWVNMVPAEIAGVRTAAGHTVVLRDALADFAFDARQAESSGN